MGNLHPVWVGPCENYDGMEQWTIINNCDWEILWKEFILKNRRAISVFKRILQKREGGQKAVRMSTGQSLAEGLNSYNNLTCGPIFHSCISLQIVAVGSELDIDRPCIVLSQIQIILSLRYIKVIAKRTDIDYLWIAHTYTHTSLFD